MSRLSETGWLFIALQFIIESTIVAPRAGYRSLKTTNQPYSPGRVFWNLIGNRERGRVHHEPDPSRRTVIDVKTFPQVRKNSITHRARDGSSPQHVKP